MVHGNYLIMYGMVHKIRRYNVKKTVSGQQKNKAQKSLLLRRETLFKNKTHQMSTSLRQHNCQCQSRTSKFC